VRSLKRKIISL